MLGEDFYVDTAQAIAAAVGCPIERIIISATHTHSSPTPNLHPIPGRQSNSFLSFDPVYAGRIKQCMLAAVQQALANRQPARMGYGTGACYLNVNRDAIHPETRTWYQGPNPDGPSDKTVAVLKFESLDGEPIAIYVNYAMHANLMFMRNEIGGGFPGAMARYLEEFYDEKMIALWTSGAAGDQNPLYWSAGEPAFAAEKRPQLAAAGGDPNDVIALANFVEATIAPKVLVRNTRLIDSIGQLLGEEVIRIVENTTRTSTDVRIWGAHQTISCPGRRRLDSGREGAPGQYEEGDPVALRLGLLVIGSVALAIVTGELYSVIGQRLKQLAPYGETMVVTLANGRSVGYIPDDAAYGRYTFQVLGTRLKPGHAEQAIVETLLDLMNQSMVN
ncbi:MAG: hypothetical protein R2932_60650, partial [Caldilineaceae bacterium]